MLLLCFFALLPQFAHSECVYTVVGGDTILKNSGIAARMCGSDANNQNHPLYKALLDLNIALRSLPNAIGDFSDGKYNPGELVFIPDVCYSSLPAGCAPVNDCSNGNGNNVCPAAFASCVETDIAFKCTCKSGAQGSATKVCSAHRPGGGHCTNTCVNNPCEPSPCSGPARCVNGQCSCLDSANFYMVGNECRDKCTQRNFCGDSVGVQSCNSGVCTCKSGFSKQNGKCVDKCSIPNVVKCAGPTHSCKAGICSCGVDHSLQSGICIVTDLCKGFECKGAGQCVIKNNLPLCECNDGYQFDQATNTCIDFNDCEISQCIAPATCKNEEGVEYSCDCGTLQNKNRFECEKPCANNCNESGVCVDGVCDCITGFKTDVEKGCIPDCKEDCNNAGNCVNPDNCECFDSNDETLYCSATNVKTAVPLFTTTAAANKSTMSNSLDPAVIVAPIIICVLLIAVIVAAFVLMKKNKENKEKAEQASSFPDVPMIDHGTVSVGQYQTKRPTIGSYTPGDGYSGDAVAGAHTPRTSAGGANYTFVQKEEDDIYPSAKLGNLDYVGEVKVSDRMPDDKTAW